MLFLSLLVFSQIRFDTRKPKRLVSRERYVNDMIIVTVNPRIALIRNLANPNVLDAGQKDRRSVIAHARILLNLELEVCADMATTT
jgi:hypothetical protein